MRKKYFDWEYVFEFVWKNADRDGFWTGDAASVAAVFRVSEDQADEVLGELCHRGLIEKLVPGEYAIANWREQDDPGEEESLS
jgi:predicted transcriptional regulator of viral defense system